MKNFLIGKMTHVWLIFYKLKRGYYNWVYSDIDENLCMCGSYMGKGGDICRHGGCCSAKETAMAKHFK